MSSAAHEGELRSNRDRDGGRAKRSGIERTAKRSLEKRIRADEERMHADPRNKDKIVYEIPGISA